MDSWTSRHQPLRWVSSKWSARLTYSLGPIQLLLLANFYDVHRPLARPKHRALEDALAIHTFFRAMVQLGIFDEEWLAHGFVVPIPGPERPAGQGSLAPPVHHAFTGPFQCRQTTRYAGNPSRRHILSHRAT